MGGGVRGPLAAPELGNGTRQNGGKEQFQSLTLPTDTASVKRLTHSSPVKVSVGLPFTFMGR